MNSPPSGRYERRLYGDLSWTWPIISPPEDYRDEGAEYEKLILRNSRIQVDTLLNLGAGGGHIDWAMKGRFTITACDISGDMLALARKLNPEVTYIRGDMRTIRLEQAFDAVLAGDAINYMLTESDLRAAFETAYVHLKPGGVFITCQEEDPARYKQNRTTAYTKSAGDIEITFVENYYDPDRSDTVFEGTFVYLIRDSGKLRIETDRHLLGIFPAETWRRLLGEAGFRVIEYAEGFPGVDGLDIPHYAGIKPG